MDMVQNSRGLDHFQTKITMQSRKEIRRWEEQEEEATYAVIECQKTTERLLPLHKLHNKMEPSDWNKQNARIGYPDEE